MWNEANLEVAVSGQPSAFSFRPLQPADWKPLMVAGKLVAEMCRTRGWSSAKTKPMGSKANRLKPNPFSFQRALGRGKTAPPLFLYHPSSRRSAGKAAKSFAGWEKENRQHPALNNNRRFWQAVPGSTASGREGLRISGPARAELHLRVGRCATKWPEQPNPQLTYHRRRSTPGWHRRRRHKLLTGLRLTEVWHSRVAGLRYTRVATVWGSWGAGKSGETIRWRCLGF